MENRQPHFLRIITSKRPAFLYCPGALKTMQVEKGSVYRTYLNTLELDRLLAGGEVEVAKTGTFDQFYALINSQHGDPAGYAWQREAVSEE